jgi:hypothetical protein
MKKNNAPLFTLPLISILLIFGTAPLQASPGEKPDIAIALSGGISLGSYEAGLNWGIIKYLEKNLDKNGKTRLKAVSGASAGSVNALISAVVTCMKPGSSFTKDEIKDGKIANTADNNWFREIWLPIGFDELLPEDVSKYDEEDGLLSRDAFNELFKNLDRQIKEGDFINDCRVPITMMLTREQARVIKLNPESPSTVKVKNSRFSLRVIFKVDADGKAGFYSRIPKIEGNAAEGESKINGNHIYLPGQLVPGTEGQEYELQFFVDYTDDKYKGDNIGNRKYNRVADVVCVFRCIRPPIPLATGHPFQCKPATLG